MIRMRIAIASIIIASLLLSFINLPVSAEDVNCADTTTTGITQLECEALVALYNSTNGSSWTNHDNWLTNSPVSTWYGVTVAGGHVAAQLNLSYNKLSGPIPPEIGNLTYVTYFYFPDNQLTGKIPPEFGNVTGLNYLYLNENELTGEIPAQLFSLSNIKDIILSNNQLSGQIPDEIGNATTLKRFMVNDNHLTGVIPSQVGNLLSLTHFTIGNNDFYGPLPTGIADWSTSMSLFNISGSGFWTTDTDLETYLDSVQPGWASDQSAQGLLPTEGDFVGWGDLNDDEAFLPVFQFNKQFNNKGTPAPVYLVEVKEASSGDWLLQAEIDGTDTSICPASNATDPAVICEYRPQLSDFVREPVQGEHSWRISNAYDKDISDEWMWINTDGAKTFYIAHVPFATYPTNQTTKVNPTLKWGVVPGAEAYGLLIKDNSWVTVLDFDVASSYCSGDSCSYTPSTSLLNLSNGSYTWLLRANMGGTDYTDWSSVTFTKVAGPTTKQPSVVTTMANPKIIWTPVAGQTRYQIQLYTSAGVKKLDKTFDTSVCGATTCTYAPTTAILNLANGSYKWKVRAGDAVEWGTYSAFKIFKKVAPPAGVSPTGTITASNPVFKWKKITGVNKYYLELRKASGVLVKAVTITSPTCTTYTCTYTFAPALTLAKGDYKWHVKAYHGYYGPYGAFMTFKKQ